MKARVLLFLLMGWLLALAAWLVNVPSSAQSHFVPEKYRQTVHKGLEYLIKNQGKDGHWEGDGGQHPVAMTGLVGLALLLERSGEVDRYGQRKLSKATYAANIRQAADWLMEQSKPERGGLIFSEHASETGRYMEGHGLATLFLAGTLEDESDKARREKLTPIVTRAVKYIIKAQSTQGGWYHTSRAEGHDLDAVSTTAIQIQALLAAENAGIAVPDDVYNYAEAYFKKALAKYEKEAPSTARAADTAAALGCRPWPGVGHGQREEMKEWCTKWRQYCTTKIPVGRDIQFGRDELTHYFNAQGLYNYGSGSTGDGGWLEYHPVMFDHLQSSQNKDGSWPAPPASGGTIGVGQVYATAIWCSVLQIGKRSHPSRERREPVILL